MRKVKCLIGRKMVFALALTMAFGSVKAQETKETLTLTLEQAIEIALSENPTIKVANEEITLKKVAKKEAYAGLLPEVSLGGTYERAIKKMSMSMNGQSFEVGTDNTASGGLQVGLPIFAPALYKAINMTKTDVELAVEKARSSELDMVNQVAKAYYILLLSQDSHDVLQKSYEQSEANFNVVNAKFGQGVVSEYDKIRAEVQMRNLLPSVVSARNAVDLAKLQLKVLMGVEPEQDIAIVGSLKDYELFVFGQQLLKDQLILDNNSELRQLDLNTELLDRALKVQNTNFMPTLTAGFNYLYRAMENNLSLAHYDWKPYSTLSLTLSIPLFKATNFTKVKQTKIQKHQLMLGRINTERQLQMLVTSYQNNMNASAEQVASNKESVLLAEKGCEISRKLYEVGKGTILELNDSEVALTQTKLTYHQAIYDYLTAQADLDKVLGKERNIK
ncbi:TolC family protein [Bacteroides sp. 224]|uniref:TolC family protein n=1 Tax=Bacteroides sp. 224 TaxID=2302936 RepID=UPI0013D14CD3|nr:TolC family protein [Bacteroides sp. 224]NDV63876.1 TolC family protein [Bacteroides sp. 224]